MPGHAPASLFLLVVTYVFRFNAGASPGTLFLALASSGVVVGSCIIIMPPTAKRAAPKQQGKAPKKAKAEPAEESTANVNKEYFDDLQAAIADVKGAFADIMDMEPLPQTGTSGVLKLIGFQAPFLDVAYDSHVDDEYACGINFF